MKIALPRRHLVLGALATAAVLALAACAGQASSNSGGQGSAGGAASASSAAPSSAGQSGPASAGGTTSSGSSETAPGGSALPTAVIGQTFVATQVTGAHSIVPGSTISLTFEQRTLAARAGCNNMFGPYSVSGDVIKVAQMGSTMMACDPSLLKQDTWLSAFLASGPTWTYDGGTLQLTNGTDTMQLTAALTGAAALPGVGWKLVGLISQSGSTVSSVDPSLSPWIEFQGGTVTINTSCNMGTGPAQIGDTTVTFGAIAMTLRACMSPSSDVEAAMTSVLQGVTNYTVTDDPSGVLLVIMSTDGSKGLQFQADPSIGTSPVATSGNVSSPATSGNVSSGG